MNNNLVSSDIKPGFVFGEKNKWFAVVIKVYFVYEDVSFKNKRCDIYYFSTTLNGQMNQNKRVDTIFELIISLNPMFFIKVLDE